MFFFLSINKCYDLYADNKYKISIFSRSIKNNHQSIYNIDGLSKKNYLVFETLQGSFIFLKVYFLILLLFFFSFCVRLIDMSETFLGLFVFLIFVLFLIFYIIKSEIQKCYKTLLDIQSEIINIDIDINNSDKNGV